MAPIGRRRVETSFARPRRRLVVGAITLLFIAAGIPAAWGPLVRHDRL
jgi:hypothetical protein